MFLRTWSRLGSADGWWPWSRLVQELRARGRYRSKGGKKVNRDAWLDEKMSKRRRNDEEEQHLEWVRPAFLQRVQRPLDEDVRCQELITQSSNGISQRDFQMLPGA